MINRVVRVISLSILVIFGSSVSTEGGIVERSRIDVSKRGISQMAFINCVKQLFRDAQLPSPPVWGIFVYERVCSFN